VAHAFAVASGLDSMVLGETQILGQVRDALRLAHELGAVGSALNALFQQSLRVGKRAHAETGIDRFGPSLVSVGLDQVQQEFANGLVGCRALLVGAGSMAALAAATLRRRGVDDIVIVNRSSEHARRLAADVEGQASTPDGLRAAIAAADVVVSCTGAMSLVISSEDVAAAISGRGGRPLAILDLALPHDVAPQAADLPGVRLLALADLAESPTTAVSSDDVRAVRAIVAEEVASFAAARRAAQVTPTLVALRTMATAVIDTELARLDSRLPALDAASRSELQATVRRVVDKLLHNPTVRIKQLAGRTAESSYADALAELFALDRAAVDAVTRARVTDEASPMERP
jgi:glutamyl-tRNA reductase